MKSSLLQPPRFEVLLPETPQRPKTFPSVNVSVVSVAAELQGHDTDIYLKLLIAVILLHDCEPPTTSSSQFGQLVALEEHLQGHGCVSTAACIQIHFVSSSQFNSCWRMQPTLYRARLISRVLNTHTRGSRLKHK